MSGERVRASSSVKPRRKIVVFGAGATGRGHVGLLCWQAGYEMVWVDKNPDLIRTLQEAGAYTVDLYGNTSEPQRVTVSGFRVYPHHERRAIAQEIVDAALVLTAVFDRNLPDVAETLAIAVEACFEAGRQVPLNCIACENMMDSSTTLGELVAKHLSSELQVYAEHVFGFPNCMISRVVPVPVDPLHIVTEDYNEWTTDINVFKGEQLPGLTALEIVGNQTARLERKLFIHNGGHAVCGYAGFLRGHQYIHEALKDPQVVEFVVGALDELGEVVRLKHGFSACSIDAYKADLGRRGAIEAMQDSILRVVRDPIRKLSARERLVAPALLAVEYGLPYVWLARGIVAALRYDYSSDAQAQHVQALVQRAGVSGAVQELCGLTPDHPLSIAVQREWEVFKI